MYHSIELRVVQDPTYGRTICATVPTVIPGNLVSRMPIHDSTSASTGVVVEPVCMCRADTQREGDHGDDFFPGAPFPGRHDVVNGGSLPGRSIAAFASLRPQRGKHLYNPIKELRIVPAFVFEILEQLGSASRFPSSER